MKAIRNWLFIAAALLITFAGQAQSLEKLYESRAEIYFELEIQSPDELQQLNKMMSIDKVEGLKIIAYANRSQFEKLQNTAYQPQLLVPPSMLEEVEMIANIANREVFEWDAYPTYSAYVDMMNGFQNDYPEHCEIFNFGTLNSGRELLMLRINNG